MSLLKKNWIFFVLALEILVFFMFSNTPETAFSQNVIKTSLIFFLVLMPVLLLLAVFRYVNVNSSLRLSAYQMIFLLLFIMFLWDLAFVADEMLKHFGLDIDKLYTNISVFVAFFIFWLVQHAFFAIPFVRNRAK